MLSHSPLSTDLIGQKKLVLFPFSLHTVRFVLWSSSRWFTDLTSPSEAISSQSEKSPPPSSFFPIHSPHIIRHIGECSVRGELLVIRHRKRENYSHTNRQTHKHTNTHHSKKVFVTKKNSFSHVTASSKSHSINGTVVRICNETKKQEQESKYKYKTLACKFERTN